MLPDFPQIKGKLRSILNQRLKRTAYQDGIVSRIRRFRAHEGQGFSMEREDGSSEQTNFRERSVELTLTKEELIKLTPKELIEKVDKMAGDMAKQTTEDLFAVMHKATTETGNVVDGKGQPFSFDLFLEGLKKVEMDFDDAGKPSGMTVLVPPQVAKKIPDLLQQWENDAECTRRFDELMTVNREAWRDRESRRKLVD